MPRTIRHIFPPSLWSNSSFVVDYGMKCGICKNPIEIEVYVNEKNYEKFTYYMVSYMTAKPLDTFLNKIAYKCRRRICYGCYITSVTLKPFDREVGKRTIIYQSLTEKVIREWFQDFFNFCERKDVDEYICPDITSCEIPEGLNILIYK